RRACDQSRYSVVSCVSQNSRSSASVRKRGIGLRRFLAMLGFLRIQAALPTTHVPGHNRSHQGVPDREDNGQAPPGIGPTQDIVPDFDLGVCDVRPEQNRSVEEDLLGLSLAYVVRQPVFLGVPGIPLKTGEVREVLLQQAHLSCILPPYTAVKGSARSGSWTGAA